jgi:hypothetical protein
MEFRNDQYLKLKLPIDPINILKIQIDYTNLITDIKIDKPNVIIILDDRINYYNIYQSVKILITNESTFLKNYKNIPTFIEYIIINNELIKNNNFEINGYLLLKATTRNNTELALELLENHEININRINKFGFTSLIWACYNKMDEVAIKILSNSSLNIDRGDMIISMCDSDIMINVKRKLEYLLKIN